MTPLCSVLQLTGRHVVRDVSCKNCDTRLGWIYVNLPDTCTYILIKFTSILSVPIFLFTIQEYATEESQRYKVYAHICRISFTHQTSEHGVLV